MERQGRVSAQGAEGSVTLIVFAAGERASRAEQLLDRGLVAAAHDLVELGLECPLIDRVIVVTGSDELAGRVGGVARVVVDGDRPGEAFHFGGRLAEVVERYEVRHPLYFGGGSAPLFSPDSLGGLCRRLLEATHTVIANGVPGGWTADFFGWTPAGWLRRVQLPGDQDNNLPFLMTRPGGLRLETLEPAIENTFDIDTPTDLAILKLVGSTPRHLRAYLDGLALDTSRLETVMPLLVDRNSQFTLVGRVKTDLWGKMPTDIPGPKRLFVEERGMKGNGREARGEVRSLIGHLYEAVGPERFFDHLADMSDAIFFDSRVLFSHLHLNLSPSDRFASDMGDADAIQNRVAREFAACALACPKPVIIGGQNIVAGALWALVQEAWNRADDALFAASPGPAAPSTS
jgi:hypothetical protein